MANDSASQLFLAADPNFKQRLKGAFITIALQVMAESPSTTNHANRIYFAKVVIATPDTIVDKFAAEVAMRPNVVGFATSFDFHIPAAVTASGDADLQSQLSTDWDMMCSV